MHRQAIKAWRANGPVYTVTATTYQAVAAQTDSHPFVTADNSIIRRGYTSHLRWIAVSRDLLTQWGGQIHYGDEVRVRGVSPKLDGTYTVHDTMHRRHRRHIDILSNPKEKLFVASKNVKLQLVKSIATHKQVTKSSRIANRSTKGQHVANWLGRHRRKRPTQLAYLTAAIR